MKSTITKRYSGYIKTNISEFTTDILINDLSTRDLTESQVEQLNQIVDSYEPVNCVMTPWSDWSDWSTQECGQTATRIRTRTILVPPSNGGIACDPLIETETRVNAPCTTDEIYLSNYENPQAFVNATIKLQALGIIDKSVRLENAVSIEGDIHLKALDGVIITQPAAVKIGFVLGVGNHVADDFNVINEDEVSDNSSIFYTRVDAQIWNNTFNNLKTIGGALTYNSSRGGSAEHMNITTFNNSSLNNRWINVSVYSQDGPFKALHLENVELSTTISHNIYVHPSVSLNYKNVKSLNPRGVGKLMMHQYSGSGNGGYGTAIYSMFENVDSGNTTFEMTSLKAGSIVQIKDSRIAPYVTMGVPPAEVYAVNTEFVNNGNGILIAGTLENCTGGVWSTKDYVTKIINSNFVECSMRGGGTILSENSQVEWMSVADRGEDFSATFTDSIITNLGDGKTGNGVINLINTPVPAPAWGRPYRPEIINIISNDRL